MTAISAARMGTPSLARTAWLNLRAFWLTNRVWIKAVAAELPAVLGIAFCAACLFILWQAFAPVEVVR